MTHSVQLESLTHQQLVQLQKDAATQIEATRKQSIEEIRAQCEVIIAQSGLTRDDVFPGYGKAVKTKSVKVDRPVTHRNPDNHAETYVAGPGRKPEWLSNKLAQGVSLESMAV